MLLQDHRGFIELFAAIPDEWKSGTSEFKNLRSRGGLLVSAKLEKGEITKLSVRSPAEKQVEINGKVYDLKKGYNKLI